MPDFSTLIPPDDARERIMSHIVPLQEMEAARGLAMLGRFLAEDIRSPTPMPSFRRSTVDGYAVRAADVPASLEVVGEVPMGALAEIQLENGQAALIHTGGHVPDGADAVVMVEVTERDGQTVHVSEGLHAGDNVIQVSEDISAGDVILRRGHRLRKQDLGGLMALGVTKVQVTRRPQVVIFSSGDEVVPPEQQVQPGQVRDINSTTIAALTQEAGAAAVQGGILPDDYEAIFTHLRAALDDGADMLVVTAGSSMSERDVTADVFNALGEPGVLLHGIATKPGKPTILGMVGDVPVVGLPGNPMSAFVQFSVMCVPLLYRLQGGDLPPAIEVEALLTGPVHSLAGREDYVPATLTHTAEGLHAAPIPFKSNLIFKLIEADGLIHVPIEAPRLDEGAQVAVRLL